VPHHALISHILEEVECRLINVTNKPVVKKLVKATGAENYNVLQNNGRIAHQEVDHVHFHMVSPLPFLPSLSCIMGFV
jgi:diadenosine tetraphosphate (Ap4A) HIT family hydrolase